MFQQGSTGETHKWAGGGKNLAHKWARVTSTLRLSTEGQASTLESGRAARPDGPTLGEAVANAPTDLSHGRTRAYAGVKTKSEKKWIIDLQQTWKGSETRLRGRLLSFVFARDVLFQHC